MAAEAAHDAPPQTSSRMRGAAVLLALAALLSSGAGLLLFQGGGDRSSSLVGRGYALKSAPRPGQGGLPPSPGPGEGGQGRPLPAPGPGEGGQGPLQYTPWAGPRGRPNCRRWGIKNERSRLERLRSARANRSDPGAWVARPPHTPVFTIGLHKTGTESYAGKEGHIGIYGALGLASMHGQSWAVDSYDAFADGGVSPFNWSDRYRFGHGNSFDPTLLHECWFGASFVLSIRGLFSWLRSKLKHGLFDCTGTGADIARVSEKLRMWTDFRDRYHRRVLDFAMENPSFARRLAIIDLPAARTRNASCDICRLLERDCCGQVTREIRYSYPGLQAKNWTTWTSCVEQGMQRALRDLRVPEGEAGLVLQRPLLSLPMVRSPAVLAWLRASGYARFAAP